MFFGKENNAGKNRRQQEKRRADMRWIDSPKEATSMRLQELSRAAEDRTL